VEKESWKIQIRKAKDILQLLVAAEKGDSKALEEVKIRLEEICRVESWEYPKP
jgi:hypothetical protein